MTEGLFIPPNIKTIPQSKIKDFCQPPLHKGAFSVFCLIDIFLTIFYNTVMYLSFITHKGD